MTRPNTAVLHYSAPPVIGGVEAVVQAHAETFRRAGYPLTVVAGRGAAESLPPGVDLVLIPEIDSQHERVLSQSRALERGEVPPDFEELARDLATALAPILQPFDNVVVHNVLTKHFNLALTAALFHLQEAGGRHWIAWCHDLSWTSPNSRTKVHPGYPWDLLRAYRKDVTYVAVSEQRRRELVGLLGCPQDAVRVIYNGVDPSVLLGLSPTIRDLAVRVGLFDGGGALNVLMPVRVTQAKNIEYALRFASALKKSGQPVHLLVTGPPDPHDPNSMLYFRSLLDMRRDLDLEEDVRFVYELGPEPDRPLMIDVGQVGELMRLADLVLMPSHREGFGMPVLEAGLAGVPLAAGNVPAAEEIGGQDVFTFDPAEPPEQVAPRVVAWLNALATCHLRRRVRDNYTWDAIFQDRIRPLLHLKDPHRR